jgi:ABC-type polysaccharide/polyol phosphate export permease
VTGCKADQGPTMDKPAPADVASDAGHDLDRSRTAVRWSQALADIGEGFSRWQLWWLLGLNDIRQRYQRSRMGQLWITLSMAAFIGAIGFVYSGLFQMEARVYIPFLTVNFVVWTFIAGTINDACSAFTQAEKYLRQERLPKTVFIMRIVLRNLLILGHNALLIPAVMVLFGATVTWAIVLALPGLALLTLNLLLGSFLLAVICTRFRDMPQIVATLVQMAFFVSPVMWHRGQLQALPAVIDYNPFAHHLIIVTDPLLGNAPRMERYMVCLLVTGVLSLVALPFFARFRERVVYWL